MKVKLENGTEVEVQDPNQRKFTRFAADMVHGGNALGAGRCPLCKEEITKFRDLLSAKEFGISGMCQNCQDSIWSPKK